MTEEWRDIPGYEGKYQASTLGRIRSLDRRVRTVAHGTEATRPIKGRVLRPWRVGNSGHVGVDLGCEARAVPVHKLVALTFIGPRPEGMEICHNDGDPTNNAVSNLRYDTRSENVRDILRTGGRFGKLNLKDVDKIRELQEEGAKRSEIAKLFGISVRAVSSIKAGETYAWYKTKKVSE